MCACIYMYVCVCIVLRGKKNFGKKNIVTGGKN